MKSQFFDTKLNHVIHPLGRGVGLTGIGFWHHNLSVLQNRPTPKIKRAKQVSGAGILAPETCFALFICALPQAIRRREKTYTCKGVGFGNENGKAMGRRVSLLTQWGRRGIMKEEREIREAMITFMRCST